MMDLLSAATAMSGTPVGEEVGFSRVSTDSRKVAPGDLFIALRGENFDGHDFVAAAKARGAVAAVVASDTVEREHGYDLPPVSYTHLDVYKRQL